MSRGISKTVGQVLSLNLIALYFSLAVGPAIAADRIVLRSIKVISGRSVTTFDEDGVKLDDDSIISWDEIEQGNVGENRQAEFNRFLKELGDPLYRIRQRLKVGDYEGVLQPAETIYPRYANRKSPTAYMVVQSLMWGRLAAGKREAAVEPYLKAYEYLRTTRSRGDTLPGSRRLQFNPTTALSSTLVPVWFDREEAGRVLTSVLDAVKAMKHPRPEGAYIYHATLAATVGDPQALDLLRVLKASRGVVSQWADIARAQVEILSNKPGDGFRRLNARLDHYLPETKPAAIYWIGVAKIADDDERVRQEGVLQLLHLPALYGKKYPELAGAGLYQSIRALDRLDDAKGSIAVRNELLVRYAHTVHAAKVKSESELRSN